MACDVRPVAMNLTLKIGFILPGTDPDPEPEVRTIRNLECKYHKAFPRDKQFVLCL